MNDHSIFKLVWLGLAGLLAAGLLGVGCSASEPGQGRLNIRILDHREAIDDFDDLWLTISTVSIHSAGRPRSEGWLERKSALQTLDLTQYVDGRDVQIIQTTVEAGPYDAVRLMIDRAAGTLTDGQSVAVKVSLETVALDFWVRPDQTTIVTLDLMVLDLSDHPDGGYELHLREARVSQGR